MHCRWVDPYGGDRVNSYLRFKDIYMNEMRLDEPDLILDIILQVCEYVSSSSSQLVSK